MLYLILLNYLAPLTEIDSHLAAHRAFLKKHYDAGHFLVSGKREPRTGGVILAQADSLENVMQWISEDPFKQEGVAAYQIICWTPTMIADDASWQQLIRRKQCLC